MDIWSKNKRSEVMSRIRSKNTKPELFVRSLLFRMGYRFRLHRRDLPGSPDIVLPKYKSVIFVHGCFWHVHAGCKASTIPKTDRAKWERKLIGNAERDKKKIIELKKQGWKIFIVWECQLNDEYELKKQIDKFLKTT